MKIYRIYFVALGLALVSMTAWGFTARRQANALKTRQAVENSTAYFVNLLSTRIDQYWHKGDYESCIRLLKLQTTVDPQWLEGYDQAGWLLWSMKRLDEAEKIYLEGIAKNPDSYRLYYELGHMYYRTADGTLYDKTPEEIQTLYEKSAEQLEQAIKKSPCPGYIKRHYARILGKLGRHEEQRKVLEALLEADPSDFLCRRDLEALKNVQEDTPE